MILTHTLLIEMLYKAVEAELGLIVETENPLALQQKLYGARKAQADPKLNKLSISVSRTNPRTQLWIVNNDKKQAAAKVGDSPTV